MTMVLIPPGEFMMGSGQSAAEVARISDTKAEYFENEHPQHRVRISRPFYLAAHEVTQGQYERLMGVNPSYFRRGGEGAERVLGQSTDRFPVEEVSWFDAVQYCNLLSEADELPPYYELSGIEREKGSIQAATVDVLGGAGYRLPSEAQWEYACRAGTTTPFHFGRSLNGTQANVHGNDPYGTNTKGPYLGRTTTVGSYKDFANAFGLFDMHGNVWEWCQDRYDEDYYSQFTPPVTIDPRGPPSGTSRVLRGGCWDLIAWSARACFRFRLTPDNRFIYTGFRVSRTP